MSIARSVVAMYPLGRAQSHCSTLLTLGEVTLVAWFAGAHEGAPDSRIMLARRLGDRGFNEPYLLWDEGPPQWNPVLETGPDQRIWLFFRRGPNIQTWTTWVTRSADRGRTWSTPELLVPGDCGGRGPVRNPPVIYGGVWVAPGSVERWGEPPRWDCFVDLYDGQRWQQVPIPLDHTRLRGAGCIQPALVEQGGALVALARSTAGAVFRCETRDPYHWPALQPTSLPNNNSAISAVNLPDGQIACVHNPSRENWGARCPLVISVCSDGRSWQRRVTVESGAALDEAPPPATSDGRPDTAHATGVVTTGAGEYSYPSARVVGDQLWISYTWQRQGIVEARVPLAELRVNRPVAEAPGTGRC